MQTTYLKKITIFYAIGISLIIAGLVYAIILINGVSVQGGLTGIVILFWLIPIVLMVTIDRVCVRKFGVQKVNKVEFYITISLILLFVMNWIRLQQQA